MCEALKVGDEPDTLLSLALEILQLAEVARTGRRGHPEHQAAGVAVC